MILAIDPGTTSSAYLFMGEDGTIRDFCPELDNFKMLVLIKTREFQTLVIEEVRSYGMPVGKETFETVKWTGRFAQAAEMRLFPVSSEFVGRLEVKLHWCKSSKAKDSNVRQALLDHYGKPAMKGVTKHALSALAIAGYWQQSPVKLTDKIYVNYRMSVL